ncbi:MAG: hypothetical protein WC437_04820 [Patescibacteria group bacterium]
MDYKEIELDIARLVADKLQIPLDNLCFHSRLRDEIHQAFCRTMIEKYNLIGLRRAYDEFIRDIVSAYDDYETTERKIKEWFSTKTSKDRYLQIFKDLHLDGERFNNIDAVKETFQKNGLAYHDETHCYYIPRRDYLKFSVGNGNEWRFCLAFADLAQLLYEVELGDFYIQTPYTEVGGFKFTPYKNGTIRVASATHNLDHFYDLYAEMHPYPVVVQRKI